MPNWCTNMISIKAESEQQVEAICEALKSENSSFDFSKIVPYPERYAELDRIADAWRGSDGKDRYNSKDVGKAPTDGFNQGGYQWRLDNWGTKWYVDAGDISISRPYPDQVIFCFDTAWSPPEPIVSKLSEMFPTAEFVLRYSEPGMAVKGMVSFKAGEAFEEEIDEEDDFFIDEYEDDAE
jgi:hypothetical protein